MAFKSIIEAGVRMFKVGLDESCSKAYEDSPIREKELRAQNRK